MKNVVVLKTVSSEERGHALVTGINIEERTMPMTRAALQNAVSQSIFGVRSSSLAQIEAQMKEISHKKPIFSERGIFELMLSVRR